MKTPSDAKPQIQQSTVTRSLFILRRNDMGLIDGVPGVPARPNRNSTFKSRLPERKLPRRRLLRRRSGMILMPNPMLAPDGKQILLQQVENIRRYFRSPLVNLF